VTSNKLTISAHDSYIAQLKWSADGKFLASAGGDKRIKIWNDISFSFYKEFAGHDEVISCLAWSDSNKRIASGSADKLIKIWNLEYLEEPLILRGHKEFVRDVVWANNDKQIISCSEDGLIIFWDAQTGNILQKIKNAHASGWVLSLTPVINGVFASGGGDCMVRLWNTEGKQIKLLRGHNAWVDCVKWMDNGKLIASASGDKSIRIWDVKSKRTNRIIEGHTTNIRSVAVSYDGTLLASKADENCVSVWQTKTWNSKDSLPEANGNTYWPPKIDFHPNRMALASLGAVENEFSIHEFTSDKEANAADQNESVNYIAAKIVLVGESGVGKSGLAIRLSNNEYTEQSSTHGQQFYVLNFLKKTREDGTECEAVLWDLAGQRDYRLIHGLFLDDVDLGLIVINPADTVNPLKGVAFWLRLLQYKVTRKLGSILIGGRLDRGSAAFSRFELEKFCTENQITGGYVATSARENRNGGTQK
jgi:small GTP-binding protein